MSFFCLFVFVFSRLLFPSCSLPSPPPFPSLTKKSSQPVAAPGDPIVAFVYQHLESGDAFLVFQEL